MTTRNHQITCRGPQPRSSCFVRQDRCVNGAIHALSERDYANETEQDKNRCSDPHPWVFKFASNRVHIFIGLVTKASRSDSEYVPAAFFATRSAWLDKCNEETQGFS